MGSRFFWENDKELRLIRGFSTRDNSMLRGESKLRSASRELRQMIAGSDYNLSLMEQGGRASLIFHFKSQMDRTKFDETLERILEQVQGSKKRWAAC